MEWITGTRCETLSAQAGHMESFSYVRLSFEASHIFCFFFSLFISLCAVYARALRLKNHCLFDMWHIFFLALVSLPSVHLCEMAVELIASY